MVTFLVQMLIHTPPYVFALLAYLVWQGVLSLGTRRQSMWRMLIVPGLFIDTGLLLLVPRPSDSILPMVGRSRSDDVTAALDAARSPPEAAPGIIVKNR